MSVEASIAIVFLAVWTVLLVALFYAYFWLRNRERDTRLPEEERLTPRLEVFGSGRINQRQWTRAKGCRISVYEEFLVVSANSQRIRLPLKHITELDYEPGPQRLNLKGLAQDEATVQVRFQGASAAELAKYLNDYRQATKAATAS